MSAIADVLADIVTDNAALVNAKPWQYEYTYHTNPKLDPSGANHEQIVATMKQTDFTTQRAMDFKAGWGAAMKMSKDVVEGIDQQLTSLLAGVD